MRRNRAQTWRDKVWIFQFLSWRQPSGAPLPTLWSWHNGMQWILEWHGSAQRNRLSSERTFALLRILFNCKWNKLILSDVDNNRQSSPKWKKNCCDRLWVKLSYSLMFRHRPHKTASERNYLILLHFVIVQLWRWPPDYGRPKTFAILFR